MTENPHSMIRHSLEDAAAQAEEVIAQICTGRKFANAITPDMVRLYAYKATEVKGKIDDLGASVSQRQDRMRLLNDVISSINSLTNENNELDLTDNDELQNKLAVAVSLGVNIPKYDEKKIKFNTLERDRLIENLHLASDGWDKENKNQTQKMEILIKELDRYMMMLKEISKDEKQTKSMMTREMAGR